MRPYARSRCLFILRHFALVLAPSPPHRTDDDATMDCTTLVRPEHPHRSLISSHRFSLVILLLFFIHDPLIHLPILSIALSISTHSHDCLIRPNLNANLSQFDQTPQSRLSSQPVNTYCLPRLYMWNDAPTRHGPSTTRPNNINAKSTNRCLFYIRSTPSENFRYPTLPFGCDASYHLTSLAHAIDIIYPSSTTFCPSPTLFHQSNFLTFHSLPYLDAPIRHRSSVTPLHIPKMHS